jgi:hypothetical protein
MRDIAIWSGFCALSKTPVFIGPINPAGVIEILMTLSLKSAKRRKIEQNALKAYFGKEQVKPRVSRARVQRGKLLTM